MVFGPTSGTSSGLFFFFFFFSEGLLGCWGTVGADLDLLKKLRKHVPKGCFSTAPHTNIKHQQNHAKP